MTFSLACEPIFAATVRGLVSCAGEQQRLINRFARISAPNPVTLERMIVQAMRTDRPGMGDHAALLAVQGAVRRLAQPSQKPVERRLPAPTARDLSRASRKALARRMRQYRI